MSSPSDQLSHQEFGSTFLRMLLPPERVCEAVDRVMGERLVLGPMGAGPGRMLATVTADVRFSSTYGEALAGDEIAFRIWVPASAAVDLDLAVDTLHFTAEALVPLRVCVAVDESLTMQWTITPPDPDEVVLDIATATRRAALLLRVANLDDELRRFVVRVVEKELAKPHVVRATRIDLGEVVEGIWPVVADAHALYAHSTQPWPRYPNRQRKRS